MSRKSQPLVGSPLLLAVLVLLAGCAPRPLGRLMGSGGGFPARAEAPVETPPGWPDLVSGDAEALLGPFLACGSPACFIALQQRVDMPGLVAALDAWRAVRLGALGPVREDAAGLLNHKRASFLVTLTERQGVVPAEVFALFILHAAHDDDVDAVLRALARDKLLGQTLGLMPAVRAELERRGLPLSSYPERGERAGDVVRGLGRAARDALSSTPVNDGARYLELSALREQLPPPYQQALDERERERMRRHFATDNVALGSVDALTFGVPLGFHGLVVGTGQGVQALRRGEYERAARELAPAALLVSLYAGGKASRAMAPGALRDVARQWEASLGAEGLRELARDIQARREAGRFVAVGGADAALALHEARGDVARAQAWLSQGRDSGGGGPVKGGTGRRLEELGAWVDAQSGLTPEVVEARLAWAELEAQGPRLPRDMKVLERNRPSVDVPPAGAEGSARWREYVAYYEKRRGELGQGQRAEGPLRWTAYEELRTWFARGLAFERVMVEELRVDAARPRAQRRYLGDFELPRIETNVGVWKPGSGLRYADVLVIEQDGLAGQPPRVETLSFKSRDLSALTFESLTAQMLTDARESLRYYGEILDVRRPVLRSMLTHGSQVSVSRVRLIYEGGILTPRKDVSSKALQEVAKGVKGVEVLLK